MNAIVWTWWQHQLAKQVGKSEAKALIRAAKKHYWEYRSHQASVFHTALQRHLHLAIYPALSLYLALRAYGWDQATALDTVGAVMFSLLLPLRGVFRLLGRFPLFFALSRRMTLWGMRTMFPELGWKTEWVELSRSVIAFNFHACFYVETLNTFGVPELTPIFCKMDRLFFDGVSPSLRFERANTLALTGKPCDFRFYREEK